MKNQIKYLLTVILVVTAISACNSASANEVTVALTDFGFDASRYEFEAGQTYTFIITNEGTIPHEFVIAEPVAEGAEGMHEEGEAVHEEGEAVHEEGEAAHKEGEAAHKEGEAVHEEGEMHHEGLIVEVEEDELPPGATVQVEVTFPSAEHDEPLEYACHIEGHYEAGMKAPITVK